MKKYCLFVSLTLVIVLTSCSKHVTDPLVSNTYFSQWNECTALSALKDYVDDVTNPKSPNFIKMEDRIATFDMDGTFVGELFPTYFEYNCWNTVYSTIPPIVTRHLRTYARRHRKSETL